MFHPQKTVAAAAAEAKRALSGAWRGRPATSTRAGTSAASTISASTTPAPARCARWRGRFTRRSATAGTVDDAMAFADALMPDRYLEVKAVGIEVVARYRRDFTPRAAGAMEALARGEPLRELGDDRRHLRDADRPAARRRIRRSSPRDARRGRRIATCGSAARRSSACCIRCAGATRSISSTRSRSGCIPTRHDLIHKAVGWALREAGKVDATRLERYLRANVAVIPRTTFRYADRAVPGWASVSDSCGCP